MSAPPTALADANAASLLVVGSANADAANTSSLLVVGSANADLCLSVARLPLEGETIAASALATCAGGKGANQAAAAARLLGGLAGPRARLMALFGDDASGAAVRAALEAAGVDLSLCRTVTSGAPTGTAIVLLMPSGQNSIVVAGGANQDEEAWRDALAGEEAARRMLLAASQAPPRPAALLLQREAPESASARAAGLARAAGAAVVLDAGGGEDGDAAISDALLGRVTVLSPNETELARLAGDDDRPDDAGGTGDSLSASSDDGPPARVVARAWALLARMEEAAAKGGDDPSPRAVLVKLGAAGSALFSGRCRRADGAGEAEDAPSAVWQPALRPDGRVVDTTGAGDCFTAAFAVARFAEGRGAREALRFATAAACLCVQRPGAQPSMPRREEVEDLLRRREGESCAQMLVRRRP